MLNSSGRESAARFVCVKTVDNRLDRAVHIKDYFPFRQEIAIIGHLFPAFRSMR